MEGGRSAEGRSAENGTGSEYPESIPGTGS